MTAAQSTAGQRNLYMIQGKALKAKAPNYQFCEDARIVGTSRENAEANFYNPSRH